jgi:hypothetical protein
MEMTIAQFALEAQHAGFALEEDDAGLFWIITPARPRRPSERLGTYGNSDRAWMAAALTAQEFAQSR